MRDDDRELIERYVAQQPDAVQHVDGVLRRAAAPYRARLQPHWEDALQNVRVEVWRLLSSGSFRGEAQLTRYLYRVTNHSLIDALRRQQRRPVDAEIELAGELPDRRPGVQPDRAFSMLDDMLLQVLRQVPEPCRELWRALVAGHSYRAMAKNFSLSEGTLRVRVLRCRNQAKQLRDQLLGSQQEPATHHQHAEAHVTKAPPQTPQVAGAETQDAAMPDARQRAGEKRTSGGTR